MILSRPPSTMRYIQPAYNLLSQYLPSIIHYAVYPTSLQLAVSIPPVHHPLCCISNQLTTCCPNTSRPPSTMLYIQPAYNLLSQYLPSIIHYAVYPTSLRLAVPIPPVHHPLCCISNQLTTCCPNTSRPPSTMLYIQPAYNLLSQYLPSTFHYAVYPTSLQLAVPIRPVHHPLSDMARQLESCDFFFS
ncbi:hypothetical protein RRG08_059909 [Elysia crispata]|uniref:Uncharacterized protein n=1 Tax=Elysia crispata TaxID=231223 RepID=A0AAE1CTI9_9GAST|nr:hypothetical protein RRG08_059909 [Elysia crispata]